MRQWLAHAAGIFGVCLLPAGAYSPCRIAGGGVGPSSGFALRRPFAIPCTRGFPPLAHRRTGRPALIAAWLPEEPGLARFEPGTQRPACHPTSLAPTTRHDLAS